MAVVVVTAVMAVVVVIVVESVSILEYIPRLLIHLLAKCSPEGDIESRC